MAKPANRGSFSRRQFLALPLLAAATCLGASAGQNRLALVVGNRVYPDPFDLPPIPKNVRDVSEALERRGFQVTTAADLVTAAFQGVMGEFAARVRAAGPGAIAMFFFSGHGVQAEAENLLLSAGMNPAGLPRELLGQAIRLRRDVLDPLTKRPSGLTMAVIDACRTSITSVNRDRDGLNQIEPPPGALISFATGAGKPAIAPVDPAQNTFYTGSFVRVLNQAPDDVSFSEFFRLVKADVTRTMENHPVRAIRQIAQIPFIAENTQERIRLGLGTEIAISTDDSEAWGKVDKLYWPAEVLAHAEAYLRAFPDGRFAASAAVVRDGAREAIAALGSREVRLYRSSFAADMGDEEYRSELRKAARGDKDAAARIGRMYREGMHQLAKDLKRWEGWLQYSVELGNGIASYELALHYLATDQPHLASRYEARARALGFTPPPTLDNSRK
ncbi:caspase family protein [Niveibacterium sp. 24ML]|uniref:caspase family protein n=1 Tax=Niveibacterium sp. 24ML TaxID=2985512 RepID=UPI0022718968|nr:caspase family protein [Niveibacterium sp. 24ML]